MLELLPDDAFRFEAQTVSIELYGFVQVVYRESNQSYARLHGILHSEG